jgi:hypothetical protein
MVSRPIEDYELNGSKHSTKVTYSILAFSFELSFVHILSFNSEHKIHFPSNFCSLNTFCSFCFHVYVTFNSSINLPPHFDMQPIHICSCCCGHAGSG